MERPRIKVVYFNPRNNIITNKMPYKKRTYRNKYLIKIFIHKYIFTFQKYKSWLKIYFFAKTGNPYIIGADPTK